MKGRNGARLLSSLAILFAAAIPVPPAHALNGGTTYPRLAYYTSRLGDASPAMLDSLARADLIVYLNAPRTENVAALRSRNPKVKIFMELQPQYIQLNTDPNAWWRPDTLKNPQRWMQWACFKNPQWLMRDTSGRLIPVGGQDYLVNWTTSCPVGTYGSTKGLRAAQWYPIMLSQVCLSGRGWPRMSWDAGGTLNGIVFEILADCLGSYGHLDLLSRADPDRDGVAEGVYHTCAGGGGADPLSVMMRTENAIFWSILRTRFPQEFVLLCNENSDAIGPSWRTKLSGMKLENWNGDDAVSWRAWWYGATGRGYLWAERNMGRSLGLPDQLRGWDLSILRMATDPRRSPAENARRHRLALGTCLLGPGYYYLDPGNERSPSWTPEFGRDLGVPLGECYPVASGADTLWVRRFTRGVVRVNPSGRALWGVGAHDAAIP